MTTRGKRISLFGGMLLALYCLGYVGVRLNHNIIHAISADASGNCTWHGVMGAYYGHDSARLAAFYAPLRYIELGFWYVARPPGSSLSQDEKRSFGLTPETNSTSGNPKRVEWDRAVELIKSGQVTTVMQAHSLHVSLCTTGGVWYHTKEPAIDEVFQVIRKFAPNEIGQITE